MEADSSKASAAEASATMAAAVVAAAEKVVKAAAIITPKTADGINNSSAASAFSFDNVDMNDNSTFLTASDDSVGDDDKENNNAVVATAEEKEVVDAAAAIITPEAAAGANNSAASAFSFDNMDTNNTLTITASDDTVAPCCCVVCGQELDGTKLACVFEKDDCLPEIAMHVFCGKTAAILSHIDLPQYEIINTRHIRNKHGKLRSRLVQMALPLTRFATVLERGKYTRYYLTREFNANMKQASKILEQEEQQEQGDRPKKKRKTTTAKKNAPTPTPPATASTAAAAATSTANSPYKATMDRIAAALKLLPDSVGYTVVRGVATLLPDATHCTQQEMDTLRIILYDQQRQQASDDMLEIVSVENDLFQAYSTFRDLYIRVARHDIQTKFNMLLGFTNALQQQFCQQTPQSDNVRLVIQGLARTWKNMLPKIQIDEEFSRPGIEALLEDFQATLANANPPLKFTYC